MSRGRPRVTWPVAALVALAALALGSPRAHAEDRDGARCESCPSATVSADAALDLGMGFQLFSRHLRYEDDLYGFLRPYDLPAGPAFVLAGRFYPGRLFTDRWPSIFGLEVGFQRSFAIVSERPGGERFPSVNRMVDVNALARVMIRRNSLVARFGYGSHLYELRVADPSQPSAGILVPDVPSVEYRYLRYGADARIAIVPRVAALAGASFLQVLDAGGIEDEVWFPHLGGNGVELSCGVVVGIARGFEVRATLDYRRYFFAFNPVPGYEDIVAGGALDSFLFYSAAVAYRF